MSSWVACAIIEGVTFGLTMRYLGIALGVAVALGYSAAFGTLVPPIMSGEISQIAGSTSGRVILLGVAVCLAGIATSGLAGVSKERVHELEPLGHGEEDGGEAPTSENRPERAGQQHPASDKANAAVGNLIQGLPRESLVLSTKVFWGGSGPNDSGLSRKHIVEGLHKELKRLQTDYVDLLFCHRPDPNTPIEETVWTMDNLIRQGKALYWGTSEWLLQM